MLTANNLSHLVLTHICLPTTEGFPFYATFPCFLSLPSLDLSVVSPNHSDSSGLVSNKLIKIDVWGLGERLPLQPCSVTLVINHRCAAPNSNKHALHSHKHSVERPTCCSVWRHWMSHKIFLTLFSSISQLLQSQFSFTFDLGYKLLRGDTIERETPVSPVNH